MAIITIAANTKQVFCISSSQLNGKRTSTEQTTNNELHDIHQITSSQKITPNRIAKDWQKFNIFIHKNREENTWG